MLIPKRLLGIANWASKDKSAPQNQVVEIARDVQGRPCLFATNGAVCIGASWNELEPDNWPAQDIANADAVAGFKALVQGDDLQRVQAMVPTAAKEVEDLKAVECALLSEHGTERARFFSTDTKHHANYDAPNCSDRIFPDIRSVLGEKRKKGTFQFSVKGRVLAGLIKTVQDMAETEHVVVTISPDDGVSIRVEAWNNETATAVTALMGPYKLDEAEWLPFKDVLGQVQEPAFMMGAAAQPDMFGEPDATNPTRSKRGKPKAVKTAKDLASAMNSKRLT